MNIDEIEELTEKQAKEMALEHIKVKGHDIYFVNLGEYFGYSVLVFLNGGYLYHANDYELHHHKKTESELRELYLEEMNNILFEENEFNKISSYDDYQRKSRYLVNHYAMQKQPYISYFFYGTEEERARRKEIIKNMYDNKIGLCYMDDEQFIKKHYELWNNLQNEVEKLEKNYKYLKSAFIYEMGNHEYQINYQGDYDVLSCFGNIRYNDSLNELDIYFRQLGFNETQKKAYLDAQKEYLQTCSY